MLKDYTVDFEDTYYYSVSVRATDEKHARNVAIECLNNEGFDHPAVVRYDTIDSSIESVKEGLESDEPYGEDEDNQEDEEYKD